MVYYSGRDIHIVTPGADAGYQVIDGLGQAGLPPLWLAFLGNHFRSLEKALHEDPQEAPDAMIGIEETADSEATLSVNESEETISAEEVTMMELEQERQSQGKKRKRGHQSQLEDVQKTKKCRGVYGVERRELWCKMCKNKKKCTKFTAAAGHSGRCEDLRPTQ